MSSMFMFVEMNERNKIACIKAIRREFNLGLLESKRVAEGDAGIVLRWCDSVSFNALSRLADDAAEYGYRIVTAPTPEERVRYEDVTTYVIRSHTELVDLEWRRGGWWWKGVQITHDPWSGEALPKTNFLPNEKGAAYYVV